MLLEREATLGGNSRISAGLVALAGTPQQRAAGVADDGTQLFDDLRATGGQANDAALVRAYAAGQDALAAWFGRGGIEFTGLERGAGQSVPRAHQTDAGAALERLARDAAAAGVTVRTGARVRRLRLGPEGIALEGDGAPATTARAVVLATGGFAHSDALLDVFAPSQKAALRVGTPGCQGDGLRMGWALGADLRDMGSIKGTFGAHADSRGCDYHALLAFYMGGIVVDRTGRRFVNEEQPYKLLGEACLHRPGAAAFQIFDAGVMARSDPAVPLCDPARQLAAGRVTKAVSWEALATACGIDGAGLVRTVDDYNRGVADGRDAWGRRGLNNGKGALVPLRQPPFYAFPCGTALLATYCGLRIDPAGQVLDVFGAPIAGLFAAGEVAGGFHGTAYMTGATLGPLPRAPVVHLTHRRICVAKPHRAASRFATNVAAGTRLPARLTRKPFSAEPSFQPRAQPALSGEPASQAGGSAPRWHREEGWQAGSR